MTPNDLQSEMTGKLVRTLTGYHAYVPHPPPDTIDYNPIASDLARAEAAIGELSGLSRVLPNPELLINAFAGREAVASTQIEGTQAGLEDVLQEELQADVETGTDAYEIRNYLAALRYGVDQLAKLPLATRLIREMHRLLLQDVRGAERRPGEFRTSQNWIRGTGPADALYVPPPPDLLPDLFAGWERFVNDHSAMPDLVRCAIAHEYFETLHPFLDGNGRLGRLIIIMMLIDRGRLHRPLLYVSKAIEQTKALYYEKLQRSRTHGERTEWVRYFLRVVESAARDGIKRSDTMLALRERLREEPLIAKHHRARLLIDELFVNPYVTVARAANRLNVTVTTATATVQTLERAGVLRETTGKARGRVWVADAILDAIRRDD